MLTKSTNEKNLLGNPAKKSEKKENRKEEDLKSFY